LTWGKLNAESVRAFVENYYNETVSTTVEFESGVYSGAELQTLVYKYKTLTEFLQREEKIETCQPI